MTGPAIMFGAALVAGTMLEIDFRRQRRALHLKQIMRRRRCTITRADARWLADALGDPDCPACDRPLASHSR